MRTLLAILASFLLAAAPALGDEVRLKNGSVLHGRIVREDKDSITIDLGRGRMDIARRNIETITRTAPVGAEGAQDPAALPRPAPRPPAGAPGNAPVVSPRVPVVTQPRKPRARATGPAPKVVPVERTQPQPPPEPSPAEPPPPL